MDHPDALSLREMLGRTHSSEESGEEDDAGTGSDQESEEEKFIQSEFTFKPHNIFRSGGTF